MARTIYHIATDEKFVNTAYFQFTQATQWRNKFYILSKDTQQPLTHVTLQENMFVLPNTPQEKEQLAATVGENDIVVFHSLISWYYKIIFKLPARTQTVWLCYGFEVYNDPVYFSQKLLYSPLTTNWVKEYEKRAQPKSAKSALGSLKDWLKPNKVTAKQINLKKKKHQAVARMDYIGTSFKEEFNSLVEKLDMKKKFIEYWHYPLEQIIDNTKAITTDKKHLLVGNSGFPTLNHLDVFNALASCSHSQDKEIVVPLNYGDEVYISTIMRKGRDMFGDRFRPIDSFMSLPAYNEILEKVGIAIFYCHRQQALGNILALLYLGAKIYLSRRNPIYQFLVRNKFIIYDFETDILTANSFDILLLEEMKYNRAKVQEILAVENVLNSLEKEIKKVNIA